MKHKHSVTDLVLPSYKPIHNFKNHNGWPEKDGSSSVIIFLVAHSPGGDL